MLKLEQSIRNNKCIWRTNEDIFENEKSSFKTYYIIYLEIYLTFRLYTIFLATFERKSMETLKIQAKYLFFREKSIEFNHIPN